VSSSDDYWSAARIVGDVTVSSNKVTASNLSLAAGAVLSFTNSAASLTLVDISGLGEIDIRGDDSVNTPFESGGIQLIGGVTFDNFGDTTFHGGQVSLATFATLFETTAWAGDQITIENHAGATWNAESDFAFFGNSSGTNATFYNDGIFLDSTIVAGEVDFAMDVVNDDLMEGATSSGRVDSAGFTFEDSLTGTGTIDMGHDQVTADGLVGSGQTLEFTSPASSPPTHTLTLNDVQEFSGLITGFDQSGVTNDQLIVNTATWHYQDFVANSGGGSLMFTNGSAETAVNLTGSYDPTGFVGVVSGNQTTITYSG